MNILIVHPCKGFYGGAEEVVVQLCKYLLRTNHQVCVLLKDAPVGLQDKMGLDSTTYKNVDSWLAFRSWTKSNLWTTDVICCFNFPATLMTFPTKKPVVWYCNEPPELFTNWKRKPIEVFNRWWVRKSGMKVVVADEFQEIRFDRTYKVYCKVIPYGIDYGFWSQGDRNKTMQKVFSSAYGPKNKVLKLLQVGTITPYKSQIESIIALGQLLIEGIDAELTLAGSITNGNYGYKLLRKLDYIEEVASTNGRVLGIRNKVHFLGQQTHEEVRQLYHFHDILLHPVKGQGGWLVPFEAMCAGIPVITTPEFSGASIIKANALGQVTDDFVGTIRMVMESQEAVSMSDNMKYLEKINSEGTKQWVKENLTWEKFGEGMVEIFKEAISDKVQ